MTLAFTMVVRSYQSGLPSLSLMPWVFSGVFPLTTCFFVQVNAPENPGTRLRTFVNYHRVDLHISESAFAKHDMHIVRNQGYPTRT